MLAGCGDDDTASTSASSEEAPSTLSVTATDYGFGLDAVPDAGPTRIDLANTGGETHHVQLLRIGADGDAAAIADSIRSGDLSVLGQGTLVGGPGGTAPGSNTSTIVDLQPGSYVAFCEIPAADGTPHSQLGMVATFEVGGEAAGEAGGPSADATITITDAGYDLPEGFDGSGTLRVVNDSAGAAEAALFGLAPGATPDDVLAFLGGEAQGPPPFTIAGGVTSLAPGVEASTTVELPAGEYLVLSFTPDATGVPGFVRGLMATFTVA